MPNPSNTCPMLSLDTRTTKQLKLLPTLTETANGLPGHTACVCNRSCTDSLCQGRKTCKILSPCEQLRCFPPQLTAPLLQACMGEDRPECSRQTLCYLLLHLWAALPSKHLLQQPQNLTGPPKTAVSHTKEHFLPFLPILCTVGVKQLPHYSRTPNSLLLEFTSALLQLYNICIIKMSAKGAKKNSFLFRGSSVVKMMSSESAKLISCGYILQEIQEAQLSC